MQSFLKKSLLFFCLFVGITHTKAAISSSELVNSSELINSSKQYPVAQSGGGVNDTKAHDLIKKSKKYLESNKSLKINFSYKVSSFEKTVESGKGSLLISGTSYKMQIADQVLYCDGSTLYTYQPEIKEVSIQEYSADQDELNPLTLLSSYEKSFRAKYIKTANINGIMQDVVDLIPTKRSAVQKIRIYIEHNSHKPNSFEIYNSELVYTYTITNYQANISVSSSDFVFDKKAHPDVLINDMR